MPYSRILLFLLLGAVPLIVLSAGCDDRYTADTNLTDSTFVSVLAELHLARARQRIQNDLPQSVRDSIFRRYEIDSIRFQQTVAYYTDRPEEYTELYDQLLDQLREQREEAPASPRPDTVREASE